MSSGKICLLRQWEFDRLPPCLRLNCPFRILFFLAVFSAGSSAKKQSKRLKVPSQHYKQDQQECRVWLDLLLCSSNKLLNERCIYSVTCVVCRCQKRLHIVPGPENSKLEAGQLKLSPQSRRLNPDNDILKFLSPEALKLSNTKQ